MSIKIGSHNSFKAPNYLLGSIEEAIKNGANCSMIYLGAPQNTKRVEFEKYKLDEYLKKYKNIIKQEDIIIHAPYIVNPSSLTKHAFAEEFLIKEIKRMNYINAKFLVLHPGAFTKFDKNESIEILIKTIDNILSKTKDAIISLETMSGKGTEIGASLEEVTYICSRIKNQERIGICLDTCHLWESGYDLNDLDNFVKELKNTGALKYVNVIHLNNSKNEIGAKKDRHENLTEGKIKLETLIKFCYLKEFEGIAKILETPWKNGKQIYDKEIEIIKNKIK